MMACVHVYMAFGSSLIVIIYICLIFAFLSNLFGNVFMSLFGCNVQNPRKLTEKSFYIFAELPSFLSLVIAKHDRAVLFTPLQHSQKFYSFFSFCQEIIDSQAKYYFKCVIELNVKATYRMQWASLIPPLAVSTA
ncbi:hypothetical protein JOB18_042143 [Solea senegalensis]|uniref:Uncharacterized protein n=1 Tax=Solea senegalensis TaxID=28829 RepID=A0AAV6RQA0_SOLSE|nr:hypothetical protein JOB18_042143 [Solea senegalensis]